MTATLFTRVITQNYLADSPVTYFRGSLQIQRYETTIPIVFSTSLPDSQRGYERNTAACRRELPQTDFHV